MTEEAATRRALARQAARLARTDPDFRNHLGFVASDGTRPVIVALLDDQIGEVFIHLRRHYPEGANLLVGGPGGQPTNIVLAKAPARVLNEPVADIDVHVESTVGMFLAYMVLHRGQIVRVTLVGDYNAALQLESASA